jgi:hypothetical protein
MRFSVVPTLYPKRWEHVDVMVYAVKMLDGLGGIGAEKTQVGDWTVQQLRFTKGNDDLINY